MSEPVVINLVSEGVAKLQAELRTIDQTIAEMERRSSRAAEAGARQRTNTARAAANDQQRLWRDTAKQAEAWEKKKVQIADNSARMAGQLAKRQADTEIKEADRAARDKIRATERAERERQRIIDNSARMAGRIAEQEANREIAAMKRAQEARSRFLGGMGGKVGSAVAGVARGGLTMLGGAATLGAGYAVADAARDALATEKAAQILANVSVVPGGKSFSKSDILKRASALSIATNVSKKDVIAGFQSFTDISGDLESGMGSAEFAAKVAKGQGANFADVMQTLGTLKVQNPRLDAGGLQNLLAGIVGGARIGAISTADMAKYAGAITSTSGAYAGDQGTAQRHLLGLAQLVRPVLQSSDEAGTVVSRLSQDLASNAPKMAAAGIRLHAKGSTQLRDLSEIIPELMAKTGGDVGKLKHLGIGRESIRAFEALAPTFNAAGGGAPGQAAVAKEIQRFENASVGPEEVMKNFADVMSTDAEKFDAAMTHIREVLEQKLGPYIDKFADRVAKFIDSGDMDRLISSVAKMADWAAENPLHAIGDIILGSVAKDVAGAAIGQGLKKLLETQLGASLGGGLAIAAAAITVEQVGELVINALAKADADKNRHAVGQEIAASNAIGALLRPGGPNKADIDNARKTQQELAAEIDRQKADQGGVGNFLAKFAPVVGPILGPSALEKEKQEKASIAANEDSLKELTKALNAAARAFGSQGAINAGGGGGSDHEARNLPIPARGGDRRP